MEPLYNATKCVPANEITYTAFRWNGRTDTLGFLGKATGDMFRGYIQHHGFLQATYRMPGYSPNSYGIAAGQWLVFENAKSLAFSNLGRLTVLSSAEFEENLKVITKGKITASKVEWENNEL